MQRIVACHCSRASGKLNDHCFPCHRREYLTEAHDARYDAFCGAKVQQYHVIVVMDHAVQQRNELCVLLSSQAALKDRKLQLLPVALHEPEDAAPTLFV
ncbi:MAG: hypothetical protein ACXWUB_10805, partial [Burkholderiales bacterium]